MKGEEILKMYAAIGDGKTVQARGIGGSWRDVSVCDEDGTLELSRVRTPNRDVHEWRIAPMVFEAKCERYTHSMMSAKVQVEMPLRCDGKRYRVELTEIEDV